MRSTPRATSGQQQTSPARRGGRRTSPPRLGRLLPRCCARRPMGALVRGAGHRVVVLLWRAAARRWAPALVGGSRRGRPLSLGSARRRARTRVSRRTGGRRVEAMLAVFQGCHALDAITHREHRVNGPGAAASRRWRSHAAGRPSRAASKVMGQIRRWPGLPPDGSRRRPAPLSIAGDGKRSQWRRPRREARAAKTRHTMVAVLSTTNSTTTAGKSVSIFVKTRRQEGNAQA